MLSLADECEYPSVDKSNGSQRYGDMCEYLRQNCTDCLLDLLDQFPHVFEGPELQYSMRAAVEKRKKKKRKKQDLYSAFLILAF